MRSKNTRWRSGFSNLRAACVRYGTWHLAAKFVLVLVVFFLLQLGLIAVVGGERIKYYVEQIVYPNLQQQAVYLVTDLRQRFDDTQYLTNLSKRLRIDFAVKQGERQFATRVDLLDVFQHPEEMEHRQRRHWKRHSFRPPAPHLDEHQNRHARNQDASPNLPGKRPFALRGRFMPVEWREEAALLYRERDFTALLVFDSTLYPVEEDDLWLLIGGTLVLLLLSLLATQRLLRPLQDLRHGISNIEQGRFDLAIARRSNDELGMLATAFNRMSERVNEQFRQREQLLADISHELRSPLARMRVAVEFLKENKVKHLLLDEVEEQEHLLALLLDNARLGSLMGGFQLNYSRFRLSELFTRIVAGYKEDRLRLQMPDKPIWIEADKTLLPRVLTNLVDNALKYTRGEVRVILETAPGEVLLVVEDSGKGIPAEEHERVFAAFYRLDKSRTRSGDSCGFGLGLSLCKRIVEAHHGEIGLDAEYTQGARVWVRLPLRAST